MNVMSLIRLLQVVIGESCTIQKIVIAGWEIVFAFVSNCMISLKMPNMYFNKDVSSAQDQVVASEGQYMHVQFF